MGDVEPAPGSARRQLAPEQLVSGLRGPRFVGIQGWKAQEGSGRTGFGGTEPSHGCAGPRAALGPAAGPGVMGCTGSLGKTSIGSRCRGRSWCPPRFGKCAAGLEASSRGICTVPEQLWEWGHCPGAWAWHGMQGRIFWDCTGFVFGIARDLFLGLHGIYSGMFKEETEVGERDGYR